MNKFVGFCAIVLLSSLTAVAVPSISLTTLNSNGVFTDASLSTPIGYGMFVLLVWSADTTYTTPNVGSIPTARGSAFGSDYVLFSGFGDSVYGVSSDFDGANVYTSADVGGNSIVGGRAYLMLFATTSSSPVAGTQYVVGPMTYPLSDHSITPTPNGVDLSPTVEAYLGQPGLSGAVSAVPEPSTVGLLLVGAGLIGLRRCRRI